MRRFASICRKGAVACACAIGSLGYAQDAAPGVAAAPRTDVYSNYSDAFYNPQSISPAMSGGGTAAEMGQMFREPRRNGWYFSNDVMYMTRTKAQNRTLVITSPNLFDALLVTNDCGWTLPSQGAQLSADPINGDLFPALTDPVGQFLRTGTPNDVVLRNNVDLSELLIPNQVRMETDDFKYAERFGFRPTIGYVLQSGAKIEFSYFWINDFKPQTLVDNLVQPNGTAPEFFTRIIATQPPVFAFQRMGYLTSPFTTTSQPFWGETRRQLGPDPSVVPHNPAAENPALPAGVSRSTPREPTVTDDSGQAPTAAAGNPLRVTPNGQPLSFLWQDGEVAIANYSFNFQGGEIAYKRNVFDYNQGNIRFVGVASVRYFGLDEQFRFFFADTVYDRELANTGGNLPPGLAVGGFPAQPALETQATISNTMRNDMIGPTLGLNTTIPLYDGMFEFDLLGKVGAMANFLQKQQLVFRGDGLILHNYVKNTTNSSGVFEGRMGLNFRPTRNITLRAGWEWMWLINVGTATSNISYDLDQLRRPTNKDNVTFHGWYGGLEFVF